VQGAKRAGIEMDECDCLKLIGERDTGVATDVPGLSMMQAVSRQVTGLALMGPR